MPPSSVNFRGGGGDRSNYEESLNVDDSDYGSGSGESGEEDDFEDEIMDDDFEDEIIDEH